MQIQNTQMGALEIDEARILTFPEGLYGFAQARRFALVETPDLAPFQWLVSVDDPELTFAVITPLFAHPAYEFDISDADERSLLVGPDDPLTSLVIVNITENGPTANLRGPLVINGRTRLARQLVLHNPAYRIDHPLRTPESGTVPAPARVIPITSARPTDSEDGIEPTMEGYHARTHTSHG